MIISQLTAELVGRQVNLCTIDERGRCRRDTLDSILITEFGARHIVWAGSPPRMVETRAGVDTRPAQQKNPTKNGAEARAYRELLNFDQAEFARIHGMSQKSLQHRETINKPIFPDVAEYLTKVKSEWDQQVDAIIDAHDGEPEVTPYTFQDREFDPTEKFPNLRKTNNSAVAYVAIELSRTGTRFSIEWAASECTSSIPAASRCPMGDSQLVDTQAAAVAVGRAPSTIRSWIVRGKISARRTDSKGRTLVDLGDVYRASTGLTRPAET